MSHVSPTPVQLSLGLISSVLFLVLEDGGKRILERFLPRFFESVRKWNKMIYVLLWRKYLLRSKSGNMIFDEE